MKLHEKCAIVTGGTSGIGKATALLFAREGAKVVLVGRDESRGRATASIIDKEGGQATFVKADVSRSSDVKKMVEETIQTYRRIDVLFNNAGVNPIGTAVDTPEEVWNYVISVNLTGAFLCCKYVLPHMLRQGGGVIINMGSVNSFMAFENEVAYDASKGGVLMLTKATALDFARRNIRVNCICPGIIKTPLVQKISDESGESTIDAIRKKHPMNRLGLPEEVAKVALFLASDDSSFITGEAIAVDGGILAGWLT
jgi:NAD(P)-dependent dehydrogenase (short-subunit alcohol dehydrogenase family)